MPPLDQEGLASVTLAMRGAKDALLESAGVIDSLNVFPVPDGDTGRNMLYTIRDGVESLEQQPSPSLRELAERLGTRFTRDSRGNSGFLISAFFDAFFEHIATARSFDVSSFIGAFQVGAKTARRALAKPREGTLLTAIDYMAEELRCSSSGSIEQALAAAISAGHDAVKATPELLPLLRRAGVVDAGALGFVRIFEGMLSSLEGSPLAPLIESDHRFEPSGEAPTDDSSALSHPYCTQLLVAREAKLPLDELERWLASHCESVVIHERAGRVRIHVHSERPDDVIQEAAKLGSVIEHRVEDMRKQVETDLTPDPGSTEGRVSVLSVVPGPGFETLFRELGVEALLDYDTELPSVQQILDVLESIDSGSVILLPNDPNLAAAAGRAGKLIAERTVKVVPTESPVAGIAAMYGYDPASPLEANHNEMEESRQLVEGLALHRSVEERAFGDVTIREGHYFVVQGEELLALAPDLEDAIAEVVASRLSRGFESLTLFYARDLDAETVSALLLRLRERYPMLELSSFEGGQRRPLLWMALE